jgi:DNA polymerase-3 subunit alpha
MMASDQRVNELIDLALRVEGCARHSSVHAAGVVISPKPLHEIVPVATSAKNEFTSQYEMGDLEKTGMLKMDFLGLTTLTIIADCLASIKDREGVTIDWPTVSLTDPDTMKLFGDGRTDAIFQFESSGMQEICRRLKPKTLEDLSALNALYRPGPIDGGMIEEFILRHRGEKEIEYILPEMEDILKNTFGVLVYQEQIMQLAQKLAGYSLGEADLMRRAMGKKLQEEMAPHEAKVHQWGYRTQHSEKDGERDLRSNGEVRRLRFSTAATRSRMRSRISDRIFKSALPGAFLFRRSFARGRRQRQRYTSTRPSCVPMGLQLLPP